MNAPTVGSWYTMSHQPGFVFWCMDDKPLATTQGSDVEWFLFRRYTLPAGADADFQRGSTSFHPFIGMTRFA